MESRGTEEGLLCDRQNPPRSREELSLLVCPRRFLWLPVGGSDWSMLPGDKERGLVHQKGWAWVGGWLTVSGPLWPTRNIT